MIAGIIALVWTGPLLCGWLLSLAMAPNHDFVVYSLSPLIRALAYNAIALTVLATLALGVSALTRSSRTTTTLWMCLWLVAGSLANFPQSPGLLRHASFSHDLSEVRKVVFELDDALSDAATKLPFLDPQFARNLKSAGDKVEPTDLLGSIAGLAVLVALSAVVFLRKLRAE
jgi:hypothetical protein